MEEIVEGIAAQIPGGAAITGCLRLTSGYSNANYKLETPAGKLILRHCQGRPTDDIEYELDVLGWLERRGFPAPTVVDFANGKRCLRTPEGAQFMLLSWVDGHDPAPDLESVRIVARALAQFHLLPPPPGNWWRRTNPIGLGKLDEVLGEFSTRKPAHITGETEELFRFAQSELPPIRERLGSPLPMGLIHGDLFPDNTLFKNGDLAALIDFEQACEGALLFDLAMAVHGFCFVDEIWKPDFAPKFVAAYSVIRPLTPEEKEAFPTYLKWCPLAMMGWHLGELLRRPDAANEKRALELAERVTRMKQFGWHP